MEITINLSEHFTSVSRVPADPNIAYKNLVYLDGKIRSRMMDQRDALPAVIHEIERELVWPKVRLRQLKARLGFQDVSGPFFADHYMDGKTRKVFTGAA